MSKSDLQATPVLHRKKDSIGANLTIVFAALAVARYLQDRTGVSIKRLVQVLRPLQSVIITIAGHPLTAQPRLAPDTVAILDRFLILGTKTGPSGTQVRRLRRCA